MLSQQEGHFQVYQDLSREELIHLSLDRQEGVLASNGTLSVTTGKRTGRSPKDRFIVEDSLTVDSVDWGTINQPLVPEKFDALWVRAVQHLENTGVAFLSHHYVGADSTYAIPVQVTAELAWHSLFVRNLFIDRSVRDVENEWSLLSVPSFHPNGHEDGVNNDAAVILNFTKRRVLVVGTLYAGEMKKSLFTVLNFLLTERDVLPMHCAANAGENADVTLFFGLSGTGKTTLSADPDRFLIGDDEHGWSPEGVFNFEGGCYAKCINLSQKNEPVIWNALRHGAVVENVVLNPKTLDPCYEDGSLTQNTRAVYPLSFIEKRVESAQGGQPNHIIFLTCDLYGVLPPVSLLTREQAAYYFLSGYTAMVGSTEVGQSGIRPTFSVCFGAPFFPRPARIYGDLLMQKMESHGAKVWLVNTGWTGGKQGEGGRRFDIPVTRAIVTGIINNALDTSSFVEYPGFHFRIPVSVPGVSPELLDPQKCWPSNEAYAKAKESLILAFQENFKRFKVSEIVRNAGPGAR